MTDHVWNNHSGRLIESKDDYDLIECITCNFNHIIPIPDGNVLEKYYEEHLYDVKKPDYFERQKQNLDWWNLV